MTDSALPQIKGDERSVLGFDGKYIRIVVGYVAFLFPWLFAIEGLEIALPGEKLVWWILYGTSIGLYTIGVGIVLARFLRERELLRRSIIVPEFKIPENLKFYEIVLLYDGHIRVHDVVSIFAYYILNPQPKENLDETEKYFSDINALRRYYVQLKAKDGGGRFKGDANKFIGQMYAKMKTDGLFRYNPRTRERIGFVLFAAIVLYVRILTEMDPTPLRTVMILIIIGTPIVIAMAFPYSLHERLDKTLELKKKLYGYRMYLKTTERYRIHKDDRTYKRYFPYFVLFNLFHGNFDKMVEYILEHTEET